MENYWREEPVKPPRPEAAAGAVTTWAPAPAGHCSSDPAAVKSRSAASLMPGLLRVGTASLTPGLFSLGRRQDNFDLG